MFVYQGVTVEKTKKSDESNKTPIHRNVIEAFIVLGPSGKQFRSESDKQLWIKVDSAQFYSQLTPQQRKEFDEFDKKYGHDSTSAKSDTLRIVPKKK